MDDLTRAIAEALGCEQEPPGKGHRCEDYCRKHLTPWLICERRSSRAAAAVAPLIVARAWEAYLEGVRHGSDELDPEEFSDDIPAAVKAAIEARVQEARAVAWQEGYTSGHSNAMRRMSDEPNAPSTPNPYRAEEGDGNG